MQHSLFPQREEQIQVLRTMSRTWLGLPVRSYRGSLEAISELLPRFERRPFRVPDSRSRGNSENKFFDLIVRLPVSTDNSEVPVGTVSKTYRLLQHTEVMGFARTGLDDAGIPINDVTCEAKLTVHGERMWLSIQFPPDHDFDPGDGNAIALRLECLNSVDGSTRFMASLEWFRLVCENGMSMWTTFLSIRRMHHPALRINDIGVLLAEGPDIARAERRQFGKWMRTWVSIEKFAEWVNTDLKKTWGVKPATRAFHITRTGFDVEQIDPFEKGEPTEKSVSNMTKVPGSIPSRNGSVNLFEISQALSWLAKERREVSEQLKWKREISDLLKRIRTSPQKV